MSRSRLGESSHADGALSFFGRLIAGVEEGGGGGKCTNDMYCSTRGVHTGGARVAADPYVQFVAASDPVRG